MIDPCVDRPRAGTTTPGQVLTAGWGPASAMTVPPVGVADDDRRSVSSSTAECSGVVRQGRAPALPRSLRLTAGGSATHDCGCRGRSRSRSAVGDHHQAPSRTRAPCTKRTVCSTMWPRLAASAASARRFALGAAPVSVPRHDHRGHACHQPRVARTGARWRARRFLAPDHPVGPPFRANAASPTRATSSAVCRPPLQERRASRRSKKPVAVGPGHSARRGHRLPRVSCQSASVKDSTKAFVVRRTAPHGRVSAGRPRRGHRHHATETPREHAGQERPGQSHHCGLVERDLPDDCPRSDCSANSPCQPTPAFATRTSTRLPSSAARTRRPRLPSRGRPRASSRSPRTGPRAAQAISSSLSADRATSTRRRRRLRALPQGPRRCRRSHP